MNPNSNNTLPSSQGLEGNRKAKTNARPLAKTDFSEADQKRFWAKVKTKSPDECWEWDGSKNNNGYGTFMLKGIARKAHRISFVLTKNSPPDNMLVCHSCDNPSCVNPAHLWAGTELDNIQDCYRKNRMTSRHTWQWRECVYKLIAINTSPSVLAKLLGVSEKLISFYKKQLFKKIPWKYHYVKANHC